MSKSERWALISVYDKTGIVGFAKDIISEGWKIMASGGTARVLRENNVEVKDVADFVGGGAILKHRVVTLSREIHAGLLADMSDPEQVAEMEQLGLPVIDLLVVDFYPLRDAIAEPGATIKSVIEKTDIGGPAMVRSAAKGGRIVVCRVQDRQEVLNELKMVDDVSIEHRRELAARAEFEIAGYCLASAGFHSDGILTGVLSVVPALGRSKFF